MLEKNKENSVFSPGNEGNSLDFSDYCDAHFHYALLKDSLYESDFQIKWNALSCAHSIEEWKIQSSAPLCVKKAFGLHPQECSDKDFNLKKNADFLESLLAEGKRLSFSEGEASVIAAIGEAGFDYFTPEFKEKSLLQEEMWNIQLDLAESYGLPLVIHCRKANEKLFEYAGRLKKIPALLFHSFMGSSVEASSLIRRGLNCFFSFGKQMKNGNKKVIDCVKNLPLENLLLETDAPFQFLKGESFTGAEEIALVYKAAAEIRQIGEGELCADLKKNYCRFLNLRQAL